MKNIDPQALMQMMGGLRGQGMGDVFDKMIPKDPNAIAEMIVKVVDAIAAKGMDRATLVMAIQDRLQGAPAVSQPAQPQPAAPGPGGYMGRRNRWRR